MCGYVIEKRIKEKENIPHRIIPTKISGFEVRIGNMVLVKVFLSQTQKIQILTFFFEVYFSFFYNIMRVPLPETRRKKPD